MTRTYILMRKKRHARRGAPGNVPGELVTAVFPRCAPIEKKRDYDYRTLYTHPYRIDTPLDHRERPRVSYPPPLSMLAQRGAWLEVNPEPDASLPFLTRAKG